MNLTIAKNDRKARWIIFVFSAIVFIAVSALGKYKLNADLGFDEHIFAKLNAVINSIVALLLIAGLYTARNKRYAVHRKIMITAMMLSILFLISYICHHLLAGEARFGDIDHDGFLSNEEKAATGTLRYIYYILL